MSTKIINKKDVWENFIQKYSPQSFFQSWFWGETVKESATNITNKTEVVRCGFYDGSSLQAIACCYIINSKKGKFIHIRHGPIFKKWDRDLIVSVLGQLFEFAKKNNAVFIRISPLVENNSVNYKIFSNIGLINSPIHALDGEYCWVINLEKDEHEILLDMRKTTRYLIRKAESMGVLIEKTNNPADLEGFFKLYFHTAKRHSFVPHKSIEEEFRIFSRLGECLLFNGYYEKQLISSAIVIFYNNQAIYHHSGSIESKIPVSYLLQWEVIKEAKIRGMKIYNMWGIAPLGRNNHPWKGLSLFKQGFGGKCIEYLHALDKPLSVRYYPIYAYEFYHKLKKGY